MGVSRKVICALIGIILTSVVIGTFYSLGYLNIFNQKKDSENGIEFAYVYVKAYANREGSNITFFYNDTLSQTDHVDIQIRFGNDTVAWETSVEKSQFTVSWLNADRYTHYYIVAEMYHKRFGKLDYRTVLPSENP